MYRKLRHDRKCYSSTGNSISDLQLLTSITDKVGRKKEAEGFCSSVEKNAIVQDEMFSN